MSSVRIRTTFGGLATCACATGGPGLATVANETTASTSAAAPMDAPCPTRFRTPAVRPDTRFPLLSCPRRRACSRLVRRDPASGCISSLRTTEARRLAPGPPYTGSDLPSPRKVDRCRLAMEGAPDGHEAHEDRSETPVDQGALSSRTLVPTGYGTGYER